MNIMKLLAGKARDNWNAGPVTIAFLGDSVTQGCFEVYEKSKGEIETVFDKSHAYHNYVAKIFSVLFPSVPVNIINAGISGDCAPHALERIERDVLRYHPDLTVVCFGLNDCGEGVENVDKYVNALRGIFRKLQEAGSEIIFMTPNMMNTHISCHITKSPFMEIAEASMQNQNEGILECYVENAKKVCRECRIVVCDCYEKWKALYRSGVDITELLANKINHPAREMNWLFAVSLVETMVSEQK